MESDVADKLHNHAAVNFYQSGARRAARYVSGLGVHEECLAGQAERAAEGWAGVRRGA